MTAWDLLGLLGVLMVGGSILIAILAIALGIVRDIRRICELRAQERQARLDEDAASDERVLAGILSPHRRRGELRVITGGRHPEGGAA